MTGLVFLLGITLGGTVAWWRVSRRASGLLTQSRVAMHREIRYWQAAAERANAEAQRLAREAESWSAGCRQGREDVISIVPLLMAAQQPPADCPAAAGENDRS